MTLVSQWLTMVLMNMPLPITVIEAPSFIGDEKIMDLEVQLFVLVIFAKNENISQSERNILRELTIELVSRYKGGKT